MLSKIASRKRGQVWQIDFVIALIIVSATIYITYQNLKPVQTAKDIDELSTQAFQVSEMLIGPGIPLNWSSADVGQIGLTTNNTVDARKVTELYNMTDTLRRLKLGVDNKVFIVLQNQSTNLTFAGNDHSGPIPTNAKKSAIVTRYLAYDGYIITLQVTVWI